jgi:L-tartrate/succinate antiporter
MKKLVLGHEVAQHGDSSEKVALWRIVLPFAISGALALMPAPQGLAQHAWYFFSFFAGVVAALVVEPIAVTAIGVIAISATAALSKWILFSPGQLANPKFKVANESVKWAFSGFSNSTCWLVAGAFMFALAYKETGLGRRIALYMVKLLGKSSLLVGYAVTFTELILAPFTPSNTARGAGTVFPVVVNIPGLFGSKPHDPSSKLIGNYVMWTAFAANTLTSSLFITGCAPNFLASGMIKQIIGINISYGQWFMSAAPVMLGLILTLPLISYFVNRPQLTDTSMVPAWASAELKKMGAITRNEVILTVLVSIAILLWIFADEWFEGAIVAFMVISMLLILRVLTWEQMAKNHAAWTTLVLLATLVAMASALDSTGFIKWFAAMVGSHITGMSPLPTVMAVVAIYYLAHYFFSSLTAHTTAMLPIMLGIIKTLPGIPVDRAALALAITTGIMGVVSPYATGAALPYYNSGYLTSGEFWKNNIIFAIIFMAAWVLIGVPILLYM